jgi:hypothetical protein
VAERVNVPGGGGDCAECLLEPSVADGHLIDHVFVVRCGLVTHAPAAIQELNLSIIVQRFHSLPLSLIGLIPPPVQKGNLNNGELVSGVFGQLLNNSINGILHTGQLRRHVTTIIVVIDSLEPSNIIMGVWDEVDGDAGCGLSFKVGVVVMCF